MRRLLFAIACTLLLLLWAAIVALWARSYWIVDGLTITSVRYQPGGTARWAATTISVNRGIVWHGDPAEVGNRRIMRRLFIDHARDVNAPFAFGLRKDSSGCYTGSTDAHRTCIPAATASAV